MRGALGTVLLAGVVSGVPSTPGVVAVPLISGEVVTVSASCGVVTTTGVGGDGVSISVSASFSGGGVLIIVVGVSETVVSRMIGVGVGVSTSVSTSVSVSCSSVVARVGVFVVIGYVDIELVVMVKVCVIGTVIGVWLTVTTVLVTR